MILTKGESDALDRAAATEMAQHQSKWQALSERGARVVVTYQRPRDLSFAQMKGEAAGGTTCGAYIRTGQGIDGVLWPCIRRIEEQPVQQLQEVVRA